MEIQCSFETIKFFNENIFNCIIKDQQIPENQDVKIIGQYQVGTTHNEDVHCVQFERCKITKIPQGLTKIFPNLTVLNIEKSKLKKIAKDDLIEYKNLKKFRCGNNEIEFLPGDLFEGFENLELISFYKNKLKVIEPNILDGLNKLKCVSFQDNLNYGKFFSIYPNHGSNATLEEVKFELFEKYPFKDLKKSEENLRQEIQQLKDSKLKLETELEQEKLKNSELNLNPQNGFFVDLKAFTQDETTKDFQIQIDDSEFPVHKFLLAARSPTLAEILKNNPEVENLNLVDISVEIFEIILKFLYTDELPGDDGTNFMHLFAAAGKLKIQKLMNYAATNLIDQVDEENATEVFNLSNRYGHDELRQKAFDEIKKMYPKYDFEDAWVSNHEFVMTIIEQFKKNDEAIRKLKEKFNMSSI